MPRKLRFAARQVIRRVRYAKQDLKYKKPMRQLMDQIAAKPPSRETVLKGAVARVMAAFDRDAGGFRFSHGSTIADLYSTVYGVSVLGLVGRLDELGEEALSRIGTFIIECQDADGLFRDPNLVSPIAETGHGWGWRHLLPHGLIALDYLGLRPKNEFRFLDSVCSGGNHVPWIRSVFAGDVLSGSNEFMNTVVALQYARDFMSADQYGPIIDDLLEHAVRTVLPRVVEVTRTSSRASVSNTIKTIYHVLPSVLYERELNRSLANSISRLALSTEHPVSGFGTTCVSDACEDMDTMYLLAAFACPTFNQQHIPVLRRALSTMMVNRTADGGFVFKRFVPFHYGQCELLRSDANQSDLFATWFRLLSFAFADRVVNENIDTWSFSSVPGYQHFPSTPKWCGERERSDSK